MTGHSPFTLRRIAMGDQVFHSVAATNHVLLDQVEPETSINQRGRTTMNKKLHILQHSLGLDQYGRGQQYRNRFVTGPGCDDFEVCRSLVEDGLMAERPGSELTGGDPVFCVTRAGVDFVTENSPRPADTASEAEQP